MAIKRTNKLPVVDDCEGCGVCCLHMGYPAFQLPREPFTPQQIETDPECQALLDRGWTRAELQAGYKGESYWKSLPDDLRAEWQAFVDQYEKPGELDGACFWLDLKTRQCKHHQHRPRVCRDFEIGSKECLEWREHYNL